MTPPGSRFAGAAQRTWIVVSGESRVRVSTVAAWAVLVVLLGYRVVDIAATDFRAHPVAGSDEASFVVQTQSLAAPEHDLRYDGADFKRFAALRWPGVPAPGGLFFQRYDSGWAFAKPYGYSLFAAPAAWALGTVRGMAVANATLLLALVAVSLAILRLRYRGALVPLLGVTFFLVAEPMFYGYVLQAELFLALGTAVVLGVVLVHWRTGRFTWALLAYAGMAAMTTEKPQVLALMMPVALVIFVEARSPQRRALLIAVGLAAWGIAAAPYFKYSDGATWNAYAGDRFQAISAVPFDGQHTHLGDGWRRAKRTEYFGLTSPGQLLTARGDRLEAAEDYFVGRHTGLLPFLPTGLFLLIAALTRARRLDRRGLAVLVGVLGYIALYVMLFPETYVGGQSFGNRYFVQVAPSLLVLAVVSNVSVRAALVAAFAGGVLSLAFLWPHFADPSGAYTEGLNQVSPLQSLLPYESDQALEYWFRCAPPPTSACIRHHG